MASTIIFQKPKPKKLQIGIIVQARQTSQRFPGKSMSILGGKPVLQWVLERAKQIRATKGIIPRVVLAVPDTAESELMLSLADAMKVDNFCGSEDNVLERYYGAARFFGMDVIVRVTADCPMLDPRVCSEVLQLLLWRKLDYTSNIFPVRTYPMGLDCEAFTFDALEAAYKLETTKEGKEHVTTWLQKTADVQKGDVRQKGNQSSLNYCVDYPTDIERLEKIIAAKELKLVGANDVN